MINNLNGNFPFRINSVGVNKFDSPTILELLNDYFNKIMEIVTQSNATEQHVKDNETYIDTVKAENKIYIDDVKQQTLDFMEWCKQTGIPDETLKLLNLWLSNGTLEQLINETILSNINAKVDNYKSETDSTLTEHNKHKTDWINVYSLGVNNTGVIDNTVLIQSIIDSNEGKIIYFPSGTYLISQIKIPRGTTIKGDGIWSTFFKATSSTDMFVLKDNLSAYARIENCFINGNNIATRGVFAFKSEYSLEYLDNTFSMFNVYVKRCTIANIQLGLTGTASIMECSLKNIKSEQGLGKGLWLANKCTDSYFENIYSASNAEEGFYIEGFNLKLVNCKACWNGSTNNRKSGFYITAGGLTALSNCESQDNYGHGIMCEGTTNVTISNVMLDRNGNGGFDVNGNQIAPESPTQYGCYVKDSYYIRINGVASDALSNALGKHTQKSGVGIKSSYYITSDMQSSPQPYYYCVEDSLSHNLDLKANGIMWQDITPSITLAPTTVNGITFTQINKSTFNIDGTATATAKVDLVGVWGNTTPLLKIPSGSLLRIKNSPQDKGVSLLVVINKTTILVSTQKEYTVNIEVDTELSEIALQVANGTTVTNAFVMPKLEIIPMKKS